ncbi:hypothetical protein MMC25_005992 [Agyrium rufum]|nr:hypothetical protein [Agyrium rufum]
MCFEIDVCYLDCRCTITGPIGVFAIQPCLKALRNADGGTPLFCHYPKEFRRSINKGRFLPNSIPTLIPLQCRHHTVNGPSDTKQHFKTIVEFQEDYEHGYPREWPPSDNYHDFMTIFGFRTLVLGGRMKPFNYFSQEPGKHNNIIGIFARSDNLLLDLSNDPEYVKLMEKVRGTHIPAQKPDLIPESEVARSEGRTLEEEWCT